MVIHTLDLYFQSVSHSIAAYLVEGPAGPVLVETGPTSTLPMCLAGLASLGYRPADIQHVLVTHIHLDHAGAAGWWANQGAQVYVHYLGAPHLIDPGRLLASATRIYGNQMDTLWGQIIPAPAEKITPLRDGDSIHAAGLTFTALETPGHARHHHTLLLDKIAFTGDAAGMSIPPAGFVDLPAPPPEFDREAWQDTIQRLLALPLDTIYPTHFGPVTAVRPHLEQLAALIDEATNFIHSQMQAGVERDTIVTEYVQWIRGRAVAAGLSPTQFQPYEAANPHYMSVDGILRYWQKRNPTS
jgi:glyoxylase-like metal-dependent hydrolase (beta-lactamase superfamily II)